MKIGFLDIETSNLDADFGIMLCYTIKELDGPTIGARITKYDLRHGLDKKVVTNIIKDMMKFDLLVTFYGTKFDIPFIRTRALNLRLKFPEFGTIQHKDMYFAARSKLRLSSNRLINVGRIILGKSTKTRIDSRHWIKALQGDARAINYIYDHCKRDTADLEKVYKKLLPFIKNTSRSI